MLQIQMAALLVLGDAVAARHLWRRHTAAASDSNSNKSDTTAAVRQEALAPWWKVGAAMLTHNATALWQALRDLEGSSSTTSLPVAQYARDIAHAYRVRTLQPFIVVAAADSSSSSVPSFLVPLLGFGSLLELQAFAQQHLGTTQQTMATASPPGLSQRAAVLGFLEAQMAL